MSDGVISRIQAACMRKIYWTICARFVGLCDLAHTGSLYAQNMSDNMHHFGMNAAYFFKICPTV